MADSYELDPSADAQRRFIEAAIALGATTAADARAETDLPRISGRQLRELLDEGTVREAAPGTFYVYRRTETPAVARDTIPLPPLPRGERVLAIAFWIFVLLIPLMYLKLSRPVP